MTVRAILVLFWILFPISILTPFAALAGQIYFDCTVKLVHVIAENGEMITNTKHLRSQIGSTFTVDRNTGVVRGTNPPSGSGYLDNSSFEKITVTNEPFDGPYYVVFKRDAIDGLFSATVGYLYIRSAAEIAARTKYYDISKDELPFTYTTTGDYIYSGSCR